MKFIIFVVLLLNCCIGNVYAQENPDYLLWEASHRLSTDDFGIKRNKGGSDLSFAQFSIEYNVSGFDFLRRDFNGKVKNTLIKSASWIDTTKHVEISLRYQQTLFDLAEIYTRKFREQLKENRKQIVKGTAIAQDINATISAEFSKRRLEYDSATNSGMNDKMQELWEQQIKNELAELSDYEYSE